MGSDHNRFQIHWFESFWRSGWCNGRLTSRKSCTSHLPSPMPPWTIKILSLIRVASGRYENASPIISKIAGPCSGPIAWMTALLKPYFTFMCASSWLPRLMKTLSGMAILRAKIIISNSTWCAPRSTTSPLNTTTGQSTVPGKPKQPKRSNTSRSWPWVSPKILQGAFTSCSVGPAAKIRDAPAIKSSEISMAPARLLAPRRRSSVSSWNQSLSLMSTLSSCTSFIRPRAFSTTCSAAFSAMASVSSLPMDTPRVFFAARKTNLDFR
mmetsp:Transcript_86204/g.219593  ORF Transcript_86204/g.219593 Transcript_86204/m.219593 type:complete len:267 (+) Transcript_86204:495-1295(+)